jgi:hypothetical protein
LTNKFVLAAVLGTFFYTLELSSRPQLWLVLLYFKMKIKQYVIGKKWRNVKIHERSSSYIYISIVFFFLKDWITQKVRNQHNIVDRKNIRLARLVHLARLVNVVIRTQLIFTYSSSQACPTCLVCQDGLPGLVDLSVLLVLLIGLVLPGLLP